MNADSRGETTTDQAGGERPLERPDPDRPNVPRWAAELNPALVELVRAYDAGKGRRGRKAGEE